MAWIYWVQLWPLTWVRLEASRAPQRRRGRRGAGVWAQRVPAPSLDGPRSAGYRRAQHDGSRTGGAFLLVTFLFARKEKWHPWTM